MYSFDKIIDRRKTASLKWDIKKDELPMWVADMDFEVLPEIKEAILKRKAKELDDLDDFADLLRPEQRYYSNIIKRLVQNARKVGEE